jgi:hypothetical protein
MPYGRAGRGVQSSRAPRTRSRGSESRREPAPDTAKCPACQIDKQGRANETKGAASATAGLVDDGLFERVARGGEGEWVGGGGGRFNGLFSSGVAALCEAFATLPALAKLDLRSDSPRPVAD